MTTAPVASLAQAQQMVVASRANVEDGRNFAVVACVCYIAEKSSRDPHFSNIHHLASQAGALVAACGLDAAVQIQIQNPYFLALLNVDNVLQRLRNALSSTDVQRIEDYVRALKRKEEPKWLWLPSLVQYLRRYFATVRDRCATELAFLDTDTLAQQTVYRLFHAEKAALLANHRAVQNLLQTQLANVRASRPTAIAHLATREAELVDAQSELDACEKRFERTAGADDQVEVEAYTTAERRVNECSGAVATAQDSIRHIDALEQQILAQQQLGAVCKTAYLFTHWSMCEFCDPVVRRVFACKQMNLEVGFAEMYVDTWMNK